jgi:hypothetical protein
MKAKIVILEESEQGALGVLVLDNAIFCFCLLPDDADQKKFHIPSNNFEHPFYICRRYQSPKHGNTFVISRPETPGLIDGHDYIEFHAGNTEADSLACILLGATTGKLKGNRSVLNSGDTFKAFLDYTKNINEFQLTVVDCL